MAQINLMAQISLHGGDELKWPRFICAAEIILNGGDLLAWRRLS